MCYKTFLNKSDPKEVRKHEDRVRNYYTPEMAADELQRLSKAWRRPEDYVIVSIAEIAQRAVDARLLNHMLKFAKILNVPISEEMLKKSWKKLTQDEKSKLADTAISRIEKLEKEEGIKNE